jgi:DNA adenine methylase
MKQTELKTPISYYGGKQRLATRIISLIPDHDLYCEPFIGGGAIFFNKEPSRIEVLNDTNKSLITFYRVVQRDFTTLEKEVIITLHSRDLHRKAKVIYQNPDMFSDLQIAWSVWVLSSQSFSAMLDSSWVYDKTKKNTTSKKISNKRDQFTIDLAIRLQNVQIECTDAVRIIESRDNDRAFFYCDPPYFNSDCGHYDGYSLDDFEGLLKRLGAIKGKFLLSSYPSPILKQYTKEFGWNTQEIEQTVSVAAKSGVRKAKTEVLTANFPLV